MHLGKRNFILSDVGYILVQMFPHGTFNTTIYWRLDK